MNVSFLYILPCAALLTGCGTMGAMGSGLKKAGSGVSSAAGAVTRPVVSGSKKLATGATKLWPWGGDGGTNEDPAAVPKPAGVPLAPEDKPLPPSHVFPRTGLLVADSELGADASRLANTSITLPGGWEVHGTELAYLLPSGSSDPVALLVKGAPARAVSGSGPSATEATASELHYHAANGVLTLRGNPSIVSEGRKVASTRATTLIKIHLATGAMSIDGPVRWTD